MEIGGALWQHHRIVEGEGCIGKMISGSKESIAEPSIETRIGVVTKKHGREGTEAHNS